jgi:hypothetical protein
MPRKPTTSNKNSKHLKAPSGGWGFDTIPSRAFLKLTKWAKSEYLGTDKDGRHTYRATASNICGGK